MTTKTNIEKQSQTGKAFNITLWISISILAVYVLIDPIDRYITRNTFGVVAYKSFLETARDILFALCGIIGLLSISKKAIVGWVLANASAFGFIISSICMFSTQHFVRTNIMDLLLIMPIVSLGLVIMLNKKDMRPKYWTVYLSIMAIIILTINYLLLQHSPI